MTETCATLLSNKVDEKILMNKSCIHGIWHELQVLGKFVKRHFFFMCIFNTPSFPDLSL